MSKVLKQVFKDRVLDKNSVRLQAQIAAATGKTVESVKRWVREDSEKLNLSTVEDILCEEFGLIENSELYEVPKIEPATV